MKRLRAILEAMERNTPECDETVIDFYGFTIKARWDSDEEPRVVGFDITYEGELIEQGLNVDDALAVIVTSIPFGNLGTQNTSLKSPQ